MRKRRFLCSARRNFWKSLKMAASPYKSMMKLNGVPMLPPVIKDTDRPTLKKYHEEAMKIEADLAEKQRMRAKELEAQESSTQSHGQSEEYLNDTIASNMDTAEVLNIILQALRDSSHVEEVQQLQHAIFEELQKYQSPPTSFAMKRGDSMDTLHNIDDLSNAAVSSYEISPSKSFQGEKHPAPLKVRSSQSITDVLLPDCSLSSQKSPTSIGSKTPSPLDSRALTEPRLSLNYSSGSISNKGNNLQPNKASTPEPLEVKIASADAENSSRDSSQFDIDVTALDSPPRPLRRNSYTLESPSPSVIQFLQTLKIDDASRNVSTSEKSSKRNLNNLWSEALSIDSRPSSTPTNQSALSWHSQDKSDPSSSSELCNLSVIQNDVLNENFCLNEVDNKPQENNRDDMRASRQSNNRKFSGNNNIPMDVDVAAAKIQAGVRGYLTRRLLKTGRIIELKNAIRDSLVTALQMHTETSVSKAELELHRRLTMQIESLCDEWHEIFFEYTPQQRMRLITIDRNKAKAPKPKKPFLRRSKSKGNMESSETSLTSSTKSIASRPKSLPLTKPLHASPVQYRPWK